MTDIRREIGGRVSNELRGEVGDWIIKGVKGEFYPCKPDVFQQSYEPVEHPDA